MTATHEEIQQLLAGHALRALDEVDRAEAERQLLAHVPRCADCRALVHDLAQVAGDLALATPAVAPPRLMLGRLRRTIAGLELAERRTRLPWWAATAAAAVAVVGLAGWTTMLSARLGDTQVTQSQMVDAFTTIADPRAEDLSLLEGSLNLQIHWSPEAGTAFVAGRAPRPAEGVYQVWLLRNGAVRRDAGTFLPNEYGAVWAPLYGNLDRYEQVFVTIEPEGGSQGPTGDPILTADIA